MQSCNVTKGDTYRVIQEERSILWEVILSIIVRQKNSNERPNFEWLPRCSCLNLFDFPGATTHCDCIFTVR